jgi:hypothetical protein
MILNQFTVTIMDNGQHTDAQLKELSNKVSDALDEICFNDIIRQKLNEHGVSGVFIKVED